MSINFNDHDITTSGNLTADSGNFTTLLVNNTGVSVSGHSHTSSDISDFNSAVVSVSPEEVLEYATSSDFPASGIISNLYISTDYSKVYRWSGNSYVEIGPSPLFVANHTHSSSDITNFNSSVSGLLPVKNIVAGSGISISSSESNFTINAIEDSRWLLFLPPAPTGVFATAGDAQATVVWTAPTVAAQTPITDYNIQYSSNSGVSWTTFNDGVSTSNSGVVTGLTNDTSYIFRVRGVNVIGNGEYSIASSGVTPSSTVSVRYLVIAGGGGGGAHDASDKGGGGGGAGGYRTNRTGESSGGGASAEGAFTASAGTTYTVTVGGGGAGGSADRGTNGSDSIFSTITSTGGGGGGRGTAFQNTTAHAGKSGGSGGGPSSGAVGTGTANQGYDSGSSTSTGAAGGGGAGGTGGNTTTSAGGNGGSGVSSAITGSSVSRAGGGGGGGFSGGANGTASSGGGAAGNEANGSPGNANTGGGGGGAGSGASARNGGAGGSGVVIIRASRAAASTTGSPTVTTVGSDTVYTFTATGSITF